MWNSLSNSLLEKNTKAYKKIVDTFDVGSNSIRT